jgi:outer membrane protein assembly factor BamB
MRECDARATAQKAAALVAALLFCGCTHRTAGDTWPMYQFRPDHNAVFTQPKLTARWRLNLHAKINGGLAYSDGTIFLDTFARDVLAVDARTGTVRWRHALDNIIMSTPIVAAGNVIVGTGRNGPMKDAMGAIYRDGQLVHEWGRAQGDAVVALTADRGDETWSFKTGGEDMPSALASAGKLIFGNGDLHAYALDAGSGRQDWRVDLPGIVTMASSNIVNGNALVSACTLHYYVCHTLALDIASGTTVWSAPYGDQDSAPTVGVSNVFLSGFTWRDCRYPAASSTVFAVDAATGNLHWQYRMRACGDFTSEVSHERAIAGTYSDGTYYQASATENAVYAFDATTGTVRFRVPTRGRVKMSAIVRDGRLFFGDTSGYIYAVDSKTGAIRTRAHFKERFTTSPPIIVGATLFIATETALLALSPQTLSL